MEKRLLSKDEESVYTHIRSAVKALGLSESESSFLFCPKRELTVSLPLTREDGRTEIFTGYRVGYSDVLGPCKGGIRCHRSVTLEQIRALACEMTLKCALVNLPFGGGKGGIAVDTATLSEYEQETLIKAYARAVAPVIGENTDIPAPDVGTDARCMAWFYKAYSDMVGHRVPAVVTGKPLELGGCAGRAEATGKGIALVTKALCEAKAIEPRGLTVAVQGNGNVGSAAALALSRLGIRVVAISDVSGAVFREEGLDAEAIFALSLSKKLLSDYRQEGTRFVPGKEGNDALLFSKVDFLIPAALGNQITKQNAGFVRAGTIVEAANGPIDAEADAELFRRGIPVVPDILASAGGVTVSYFEWMQNMQKERFTEEEVESRLSSVLLSAFGEVWQTAEKEGISLRSAAYRIAVSRLVRAHSLLGNE